MLICDIDRDASPEAASLLRGHWLLELWPLHFLRLFVCVEEHQAQKAERQGTALDVLPKYFLTWMRDGQTVYVLSQDGQKYAANHDDRQSVED